MNSLRIKSNPIYVLIAFAILVSTTHYYSVYQLSKQNLIGLDVSYNYIKMAVIVNQSVGFNGEKYALPEGATLFSLSDESNTVYLTKNVTAWAQESKDRQALRSYLDEHEEIYKILQSPSLIINIGRQSEFRITTSKPNGISHLPMEFWLIRLVNALALLICVFVWIYKPNTPESYLMVLAGLGYYFFGLFYSITVGSELTMAPGEFENNINSQLISLNVFALNFASLLLLYPKKIFGLKVNTLLYLAFTLVTLSNLRLLPDMPLHAFFFQFFIVYVICFSIACYQWYINKRNPINKAATIVMQLALLIPAWIIIFLYLLPVIYDEKPIVNHFISHLVISLMFFGWAISILKFRLFEVERWWFRSWLWVVSTILIICMDFILIYLFDWSKELTTALTVIIVGFIYFPIRQIIFSKTLSMNEPSLQESIIKYFEKNNASNNLKDYDLIWLNLLNDIFNEFRSERFDGSIKRPEINDNGLHLYVNSLFKDKHYKLSGKQQGNRLFNKKDAKFCQALFKVVSSITHSDIEKQKVRLHERKRVMDDLHDNLGAMLLTMTYNADSKPDREQAQNALRLLRDTVYFSSNEEDVYFLDLVNRCRAELEERLKNKSTNHNWKISIPHELKLNSEQSLAISYVLREAFTNAIKHAAPDCIDVIILIRNWKVSIKIINDNSDMSNKWEGGVGINSIKRRCKSINAHCKWNVDVGKTCLELTVPF